MNYQLNRDGKDLGTFSLEELRRRRDAGELTGAELVWREGMANWQPLDSVLRPSAVSQPPPLPPCPPRRRTHRMVVWAIIAAVILFVGGVAMIAIVAMNFAAKMRDAARQVSSTENSEVVTAPVTVGTNTLTEADVRKRARAFRVRQYIDGYRQNSPPSAACHAEGLQLIEAWLAHNYGGAEETNHPSPHELGDKLAARAECNDPLVLTAAGINSTEVHEKIRRLERALAGYDKANYKAYPRFFATVSLASGLTDQPERLGTLDAAAVRFFKEAFGDGSFLPDDQAEVAEILVTGWGKGFFDRNGAALQSIAEQARGFEWLARVLEGDYHVSEAWKARGSGYANTVTDKGWKGFSDHLAKGRAAFAAAWELRPDLPLAAVRMIPVAMGDSDAEEMRLWFDRATAAQIDHPQAWSAMFWGLRPRWHGSHEEMLGLGIAAIDTKRFDTDVPRKFFDVVTAVESELKLARGERIFGRPDIWPQFQRMYEGYISEPSEAHRQDGWRSTYAVVSYLAKKYDVSREQLEAVQWRPWPDNQTGWGADLSLMPLEVAALTGALGKDIIRAERSRKAGQIRDALRMYTDLRKTANADERTANFIQHRMASLELEQRLASGDWVDFLPAKDEDQNWFISVGKARRLQDGALEVETGDDGHIIYCRARVGPAFEIKGQFEVVKSSNDDFQAGLVMGLPDSQNSTWYAYRMKRNKAEGQIASFSRGWSKQQVYKTARLHDRTNSFQFRLQGGKADAWLNGTQVLRGAAPTKTVFVYGDCLVGLGAYHDANDTVVRYRNVQVRRLAGRDNAASPEIESN